MGTALITGATAGIGREFAWQLAEAHHDLILVARDTLRLEGLAEELRQIAGVGVEVLPADLSTAEGRERVAQRLRPPGEPWADGSAAHPSDSAARTSGRHPARPVDLLVNNAGFGLGQDFVGGDIEQERRALAVMVTAVMELTHAAVPGMVARGRGAILNVSSMTALTAMGTYAAHKAWVRTFTEGLAGELAGTGVSATVLCPGLTRTEFHERADMATADWSGVVWLEADDVARAALTAVRRGQVICTPSLRYMSVNALLRVAPRWLVRRVTSPRASRRR
ncbi:SDR family NAD(P)-dependent oxidoreductase [Actinomyces oricola]